MIRVFSLAGRFDRRLLFGFPVFVIRFASPTAAVDPVRLYSDFGIDYTSVFTDLAASRVYPPVAPTRRPRIMRRPFTAAVRATAHPSIYAGRHRALLRPGLLHHPDPTASRPAAANHSRPAARRRRLHLGHRRHYASTERRPRPRARSA